LLTFHQEQGDTGRVSMLLLSTTPRMTWVWAHDAHEVEAVHEILRRAGAVCEPASAYDEDVPFATDVSIGLEALEGLEALQSAGYRFTSHPDYPSHGPDDLYGIPVGSPSAST
jgi:hypothetical protein